MNHNQESMDQVLIVGHRGAMAHAPENSMESFRTAVEMGAQVLEMDVRLSKDGVPVVMHDDRVEGTTSGRGLVSDFDVGALKDLRLRNREGVPTLSDILSEFKGRSEFIVDFKSSEGLITAYKVVSEHGMLNDVVFSSFDGTQLLSLKMKHPKTRIAFLCDDKKMQMLTIAEKLKAEALHVHRKVCKRTLVEKAHGLGFKILVWTVNRPKEMTKFITMGVDGIITDRPDVLRNTIRGMRE